MGKNKKILIVDDEPFCVKVLQRRLEYNDYEVIVASDGEEALAKTRSERPDLILLDLMLPLLNGVEVCSRLKADPDLQQIPIIVCTAKYDHKPEKNSALPVDCYFPKPIDVELLLEKLEEFL